MSGLMLSFILFNLFVVVGIGIFMYLLRLETYKLAQQLHLRLPTPLARFLRITVILPLFLMFGLISAAFLTQFIF